VRLNRCGGLDTDLARVGYRAVGVEVDRDPHRITVPLVEVRGFHVLTYALANLPLRHSLAREAPRACVLSVWRPKGRHGSQRNRAAAAEIDLTCDQFASLPRPSGTNSNHEMFGAIRLGRVYAMD
jgi:hypothetical protein